MLRRLRERQEWQFFAALPRAAPALALAWWSTLALRALLPPLFAIAMGVLVAAVVRRSSLGAPLAIAGSVFVLLQVLGPLHKALSANLGSRLAAWLYDRLTAACVRPPGMGHLEDPRLTGDLTVARDFDLGMTGPPMDINMDFIADGLVVFLSGLGCALLLFRYAWWVPPVLAGAWLATHWLLRESAVWFDRNTDEVREAQRHADYAYRLAVDPPAAKELRLFGLADWTLARFVERRTLLFERIYRATRLRERPLAWSVLLVTAANVGVFAALALDAARGPPRDRPAGGLRAAGRRRERHRLRRPQLGARRRGGARGCGAAARAGDGRGRRPLAATARPAPGRRPSRARGSLPRRRLRVSRQRAARAGGPGPRDSGGDVARHRRPERRRQDDARQAALPALRPDRGGDRGRRRRPARSRGRRLARARHRGLPGLHALRALAPRQRRPGRRSRRRPSSRRSQDAGAQGLAALDTPLARGYPGGTDLSGGQWQRVALARALCAVRQGARLVLLDEPTAQLDVRGEAEIFDRILAATRQVTTILISHRFSTVRHADRIAVIEHGRVVELGSHDELMAARGRYRTMFELQAKRFTADMDEEGGAYVSLA